MNLARTIYEDLRENFSQFCSCTTLNWQKACVATCTAILLPASFVLQMTAFIIDNWAVSDNDELACMNTDQPNASICGLGITVCSVQFLLVCFGFGLCVRSCIGGRFDLQSCSICYVCFIPTINLVQGILSLALCMITVIFVSGNRQYEYTYGISFYMFLTNGCTTIVVSLASVCGYLCKIRHDYEHQIGSDEAEGEATPILPAV
ncbi:uncharacterized protein LOC128550892 [Mercenaria mercenaria]|uniref:uncharacterized protein LOC128550892 n=1 Tax=Mercenaria mercenaria TaxID=6596 RepID=UPI00234E6B44|nr:uncharacterized protein LOC128550892 [Mercenaria mercenaria]